MLVPGLAAGGAPGRRVRVPRRCRTRAPCTATTNAPRPGLLLVRNAYDPGWHATIDGHSTRVYAADGFLTGVKVPAGTHHVVLTYEDPLVFWGLGLSVAAILLILGGGIGYEVLRRRR